MKNSKAFAIHALSVALLVLFAVACHGFARRTIELKELSFFLNFIRTSIYLGIFSVWGVSVSRRVVQPQIRRNLIAVAVLIVVWMVVREIKFRFIIDINTERYLWYSYYIPLLLMPLIALFVSALLEKNEAYRLPKGLRLLIVPTVLLIGLFLTNDLHGFCFSFPPQASEWSEHGEYSYGWAFYLAIVWCVLCTLFAIAMMIRKSRFRRLKKLSWLPVVHITLTMSYLLLYTSGSPVIREIDDIAAFYGLVFVGFFEICIRLGLIASNTGYSELFSASKNLSLQITDDAYRVQYAAETAEFFAVPDMVRAEKEEVQLNGSERLHNMKIRGGHAVWTENIAELTRQKELLRQTQEELNDREEIVRMEFEEKKRKRLVEEQNRLYDLLQESTQKQLDRIKVLANLYRETADGGEKHRLLSEMIVLGSFVKRRKDFCLSADSAPTLPVDKLKSALAESFWALRLLSVSGCYTVRLSRETVSAKLLIGLYDFFEDALESVMPEATCVVFTAIEAANKIRVCFSCDAVKDVTGLSELSQKHPELCVETDRDGTRLIWAQKGGQGL